MNLLQHGSESSVKKITKASLTQTIKFICIFAAYIWFAIFSFIAFLDFKEQKTGLNQFLEPVKELAMPSITVCSQEIFHDITNETTADMMLQNLGDYVFKKKDLVHTNFNLGNVWNLQEIFSSHLGLCLNLRTEKTYNGRNHYNFFLRLPPNKKFQVYMLGYLPIF